MELKELIKTGEERIKKYLSKLPNLKNGTTHSIQDESGTFDYSDYTTWRNLVKKYFEKNDPSNSEKINTFFTELEKKQFNRTIFAEIIGLLKSSLEDSQTKIANNFRDETINDNRRISSSSNSKSSSKWTNAIAIWGAIVGLITVGFLIWDHIGKSEIEKTMEQNKELITQIRANVNYINPSYVRDTIGEIDSIYKFKEYIRDYCDLYESLENTDLVNIDKLGDLVLVVEGYDNLLHKQSKTVLDCVTIIENLKELSKRLNIDEYKLFNENINTELKTAIIQKTAKTERINKLIHECINTTDLRKASKLTQELHDDKTRIFFDNVFLRYVIDANKILDKRLKNFITTQNE